MSSHILHRTITTVTPPDGSWTLVTDVPAEAPDLIGLTVKDESDNAVFGMLLSPDEARDQADALLRAVAEVEVAVAS